MKAIRTTKGRLTVHLSKGEKQLLLQLLSLYPRVPPAHHRLSRSGSPPDAANSQRMLDEALAEQRTRSKRQLDDFLSSPERFKGSSDDGVRFSLSPAETEWLLQVLNDIRIGSWVLLGSPEERKITLNEQTAPHLWAMELAGFFQSHLVETMTEREPRKLSGET